MTEAEKLAALCEARKKLAAEERRRDVSHELTRDDLKGMTPKEISDAFDAGKLNHLLKRDGQ